VKLLNLTQRAGYIDIASALLVYFTQTFVPEPVLNIHAAVLMYKGLGSIVRPLPLTMFTLILGGMADVMSAAILFTGTPPILGDYKWIIALYLFVKGFRSFMAVSNM
jgi:hypothetical protein